MSDRIEKLAKEYAERTERELDADMRYSRETVAALVQAAYRAGAYSGAAEARTSRSPQVEGEA